MLKHKIKQKMTQEYILKLTYFEVLDVDLEVKGKEL